MFVLRVWIGVSGLGLVVMIFVRCSVVCVLVSVGLVII